MPIAAPQAAVFWSTQPRYLGEIELAQKKRYLKDIIRVGNFINAPAKRTYEITKALLEQWARTFHLMKENGVRVPIPSTHQGAGDPEKNKGWVEDMYVEEDKLIGILELHDDDPDKLAGVSDVSIYSPEEFVDGEGNVYDRPIMHVALTPEPLVPKLGKFMPVAASFGAEPQKIAVFTEAKEDMHMDFKKIKKALGIKENVTEENAEELILASLGEHAEKLKALEKDAKAKDKELKASREKLEEKEKQKDTEKAEPEPEPNRELVRLSRKYREGELNGLVAAARITPAVRDKLMGLFIGEENGAIVASIKAGNSEDFDKLVAALKENDPVVLKEQSGPQLVVLQRDNEQPTKDPELPQRAARAYGK